MIENISGLLKYINQRSAPLWTLGSVFFLFLWFTDSNLLHQFTPVQALVVFSTFGVFAWPIQMFLRSGWHLRMRLSKLDSVYKQGSITDKQFEFLRNELIQEWANRNRIGLEFEKTRERISSQQNRGVTSDTSRPEVREQNNA